MTTILSFMFIAISINLIKYINSDIINRTLSWLPIQGNISCLSSDNYCTVNCFSKQSCGTFNGPQFTGPIINCPTNPSCIQCNINCLHIQACSGATIFGHKCHNLIVTFGHKDNKEISIYAPGNQGSLDVVIPSASHMLYSYIYGSFDTNNISIDCSGKSFSNNAVYASMITGSLIFKSEGNCKSDDSIFICPLTNHCTIHCDGSDCQSMVLQSALGIHNLDFYCGNNVSCTGTVLNCDYDSNGITDCSITGCSGPCVNPPTLKPTIFSTYQTINPTIHPSVNPSTEYQTINPTIHPSRKPTEFPTKHPSVYPSRKPTEFPTIHPSVYPSRKPTEFPTIHPSVYPSRKPIEHLSIYPSEEPTKYSTMNPTIHPSLYPSSEPTEYITINMTFYPTIEPIFNSLDNSRNPTIEPTLQKVDIQSQNIIIISDAYLTLSFFVGMFVAIFIGNNVLLLCFCCCRKYFKRKPKEKWLNKFFATKIGFSHQQNFTQHIIKEIEIYPNYDNSEDDINNNPLFNDQNLFKKTKVALPNTIHVTLRSQSVTLPVISASPALPTLLFGEATVGDKNQTANNARNHIGEEDSE